MTQQDVSDTPGIVGGPAGESEFRGAWRPDVVLPDPIERVLALARVDWAPRHRQPSAVRIVVGTCLAIAVSLIADAALVAIGTHVFPSTTGYGHFRFNDYAKLTIIGVVIGSVGWPIVTRVTSAPRRLYALLTLLFTLALFLPDAWLLLRGQPFKAVVVLMAMHVAVALVIFLAMVLVAPVRSHGPRSETAL